LAEERIPGRVPPGSDLAAPFHAGSNGSIGIRHRHSSEEDARVPQYGSLWADDDYIPAEDSSGKAVELHGGRPADAQQAGFPVIDRYIHDGACRVHHFRETIPK